MQGFWQQLGQKQQSMQQAVLQQQQQSPEGMPVQPEQRQLGADQQRAVDAVLKGDCVFLTGGAGVGKSFTVAEVVAALRARGKVVAITASTGTAAVNVDGMTLHSWAGILDVHQHMVRLAETLWDWDKWRQQWQGTDVLLVDEISMVGADTIEKVDYLARYLRGWRISPHTQLPGVNEVHELHPEPFGGLQVVSVGDFFQLPPVDKDDSSPITINTGPYSPATTGNAYGTGRFQQQQQQQQQRDDDDDAEARVPVIVAVLPPGFVTAAAAARRSMGAAAGAQTAGPGVPWQQPAAAAGATGYPGLGALQGGFLGPVQGFLQPQQQQPQHRQQQQQWGVKPEVVDLQHRQQQITPDMVDLLASPVKQQQQHQQGVKSEVVDLLASPPKRHCHHRHHHRQERQQQEFEVEIVELLDSDDEGNSPQQQQQHRRQSAEGMELGLDQLHMSPSKRQRSLKQDLDSRVLAAVAAADAAVAAAEVLAAAAVPLPEDAGGEAVSQVGEGAAAAATDAAVSPTGLPNMQQPPGAANSTATAAVAASAEPPMPTAAPCASLPAAAAAVAEAGAGSSGIVAAPSGFSKLMLMSPTRSSSSKDQPGQAPQSPAAAAAAAAASQAEPDGATADRVTEQSPCSAAAGAPGAAATAGTADTGSFEMVPSNDVDSESDCMIVEVEQEVIDLCMSQPDQQQPLPAGAAVTAGVMQPWQVSKPDQQQDLQQQDMAIDLSASQPYEQQQQSGAAAAGAGPQVIKQNPQQQQQQQQWQGWSSVLPQARKQDTNASTGPNHSAAAAAAAAAVNPNSSQVQGIDGPYTQHGQHPFRRILGGHVYAAEPALGLGHTLHTPVNRCSSSSTRRRGITSLQQGFGSNASAAAAAGDGGLRLPIQWLKGFRPKGYCFKSPVWAAARFKPVILKKPYRQTDPRLLDMLDKVRHGNFDWGVQQMLHHELQRPLDESDGIKPTEIFPTNQQVDKMNALAYSLLPGPELRTVCTDRCEPQGAVSCDFMATQLDKNTNAQRKLDLKPGAQVVLLWNLAVTSGLANGTRGVVEGFRGIREYLKQEGVCIRDSRSNAGRPTDIGAGCHHQSCSCQAGHCIHQQQQRRPGARVGSCGLSNCPCGMDDWSQGRGGGSYFVRLPDATEGVDIDLPADMPAYKRLQLQNALSWLNHTHTTELPFVKFSKPPRDANNPNIPNPYHIIGPQTWTHRRRVRAYRGQPAVKLALSRTALPLRLAWALTVHRSQGMSISKLRVHLGRAFGAGMVYVALSRCVSLDGLQVMGRVKAPETDADVLQFYKYIERIEATE